MAEEGMTHRATHPTRADLDDIQGLVYWNWKDFPYAGFLFARFGDDAARSRAWLEKLRGDVTPASQDPCKGAGRLAVAFSPHGLKRLEIPDEAYDALPQEAKDGMASRVRILGDDPATDWELGGSPDELDVLVMVYAKTGPDRTTMLEERRSALVEHGAQVRDPELSYPLPEHKEHFGFRDGVSQPYVPGSPRPLTRPEDEVPAGEILLGYPNAYGRPPISPKWGELDLGKNGSYLVFRKLHQHVARFWSYAATHARTLGPEGDAVKLASKLMGRWPNGASLVRAPDYEDQAHTAPAVINQFGYHDDPHGLRCPISSHVRRANPRDARGGDPDDSLLVSNRHRIVRRGRAYGPPLPRDEALAGRDDGVARGLYFISLQASIARGFEFIQQSWLSNPGFGGLFDEPDPIMGNSDGDKPATIPAEPLRVRLPNVPICVTVAGGGYFFLPSRTALARIARG